MYTIDFETEKIVNGSPKSPVPVGVSVKIDNEPSHYFAWGHTIGNNCTKEEASFVLRAVFASKNAIICHNAKFDLRVALEHFGIPIPPPELIIDTMIMAYLRDAREASLGLKELTAKYCGMPPDEQTDLHDWIIKNVPNSKSNPGAYISKAPGGLVGKYAESDTDRTYALYLTLAPHFAAVETGHPTIHDAFEREMKILPIVIMLEQQGVGIASNIHSELERMEVLMALQELQLHAYSGGAKPGSKDMFNALRKKGYIDESKIQYTDKGNPRYGKDFLEGMIADTELVKVLKLRGKLQKVIGTYLKPFAESATRSGGKYYPYYNQTRSEDDYGTRTGRFSSNIQQLPKLEGSNTELFGAEDDGVLNVRVLITPTIPGNVLIKRDFSGQELRVTAHYTEGPLLAAYVDNPRLDVHAFIQELVKKISGRILARTPIKTISFLKLYGGGPAKLAEKLQISLETAKTFFAAYDEALPQFKQLMSDIEKLARSGKKIRTWGGRSYDVEPAKDGRQFYYKLGNVLIQGSSADMTKEAMIRFHYHPDSQGRIFMQVHDEIVIETKPEHADNDMAILKWAMDEVPGWDVPLRSDGAIGYNFGTMEKVND